jgi:DNA-binding XRE family transcriptional regulator
MKSEKLIIKNNLQKYRKYNSLTQIQLAEKTGVCISIIRLIESKQHYPKYITRKKICDFFDIELGKMFYVEREE